MVLSLIAVLGIKFSSWDPSKRSLAWWRLAGEDDMKLKWQHLEQVMADEEAYGFIVPTGEEDD
ncbi:hypothetical protein [Arthrobacter sp. LjRoot14]|uniref:hypothetical protein n=1 Tax=Arthrobacter sp. LjRoot14 TaxID=3342265 RepID=UPI003ECDD0C5